MEPESATRMGFKDAIPVAKVVNFLLSEFSEAVSGEIIHADGGAHSVGGTMLP